MKTLILSAAAALVTVSIAGCHLNVSKGDIDDGAPGDDWTSTHDCAGDDGGGDAGTDPGDGGAGGAAALACQSDDECAEGEICLEDGSCAIPTCAEIADETSCVDRVECEPIYAGVDCSCGADCTCQPGEAGCVCDSFEFFKCEDVVAE